MKVILAQHGSRRRYLVGQVLEQIGMLEALYTDSSANSIIGKVVTKLGFKKGRLQRLANRKIREISPDKIYSTDAVLYSDLFQIVKGAETKWNRRIRQHTVMSKKMIKWGTLEANAVYAMQYESHDFLCAAKSQGLKIIIDTCITPLALRKTLNEQMAYPDWEKQISKEELTFFESDFKKNILIADLILCASEVVAEDVLKFVPVSKEIVKVVPYGSSIERSASTPTKGRVLFVGSPDIRKGIHIVAKASLICKEMGYNYDFIVAGNVSDKIKNNPLFSSLTFVGKLTKDELIEEYVKGDVFVFPSIAEGLPGVLVEALNCGLPIITTRASGLEVEDNGYHIKEGDYKSLAYNIIKICEDRLLRSEFSRKSYELANRYSFNEYKKNLSSALKCIQ